MSNDKIYILNQNGQILYKNLDGQENCDKDKKLDDLMNNSNI